MRVANQPWLRRLVLVCAVTCSMGLMAAEDGAGLTPSRAIGDQLASVEVEVLVSRAGEHQDKGEYRLAVGRLQEARMRAERTAFPEKQAMIERIDQLLVRAERLLREAEEVEHAGRRQLAQQEAIDLRDGQLRMRRSHFDERLRRIVDLRERALIELALEQARLLVTDFPESELARETYNRLLDDVHRQRKLDTEERLHNLKQELNEELARSMIPRGFDGTPIFPDDWARRSERQAGSIGDELPGENDVIRNQLAARISVDFDELEPAECIDLLANRVKVNMVVDAEVRANPGNLVTLHARNMRIDSVVAWIAQQAGLQWRIQHDAVFVTAQDETEVFTRIYDVGMLLYSVPDFAGIEIGFNGGDDALVDFEMDIGDEDTGLAPEDLTDLLEQTLGEDLWSRPGHGLSVYGTQLIASCTPSLHAQIQAFINRFQQGDDVQVNVRARWLTMRKGLAEEIGIDWQDALTSPVFHNGAGDPWPGNSPIVQEQDRIGWAGGGSDWFSSGAITNNLPGGSLSDIISPNLGDAGLSLSFGYLGAWQLAGVFKAVEQETQGRFLQGIDVTARNGSLANAFVGRSIAYIQDYDIVTSGAEFAAGQFDPVISVMNVGMALEIRPLVSADRKYVTLDFEPMLVDGQITTATIQLLGQLRVQNGDTTISYAMPMALAIQLPTLEIASAHTRVMIPDGGSILVGGLRRSRRESSKAQVPVLGNIPFLGRLFGRRGRYELDEELYLMASARIFLYQELEAQQ